MPSKPTILDFEIAKNRRRTLLLFGVFGLIYAVPVVLVVAAAGGWPVGDDPIPLLISLAVLGTLVGLCVFFADRIILRLTRARQIHSRLECPPVWDGCANAALAAGVPMPKLVIVDDEQPNAFAAGRKPERIVVGVTTGLLENLDRQEVNGVLAHEIAHIANRDVKVSTIATGLVWGITVIATVLSILLLIAGAAAGSNNLEPAREGSGRNDSNDGGMAAALVGIAVLQAFVLASMLVHLAISRRREYMADATAVQLTKYPEGLISAFRRFEEFEEGKLARGAGTGGFAAAVEAIQGAAIGHLWIHQAIPMPRFLRTLFSTHPPLAKRIEALEPYVNGQLHRREKPVGNPFPAGSQRR